MRTLLTDDGFWVALFVGGVAAVACAFVRRGEWASWRAIAPIVAVGATLVGFRADHLLRAPLVAALALLFGGEWLASHVHEWWARLSFALPGALVVAAKLPGSLPTWMPALAVAVIVVAGPLAAVEAAREPRATVVMLAIAAAGVYVCTPDTDHARAMLGGFVAAAVLVLSPKLRTTLGTTTAVGLFAYTAVFDGRARAGSVIGALACLGVVALAPVAGWARRGPSRWWSMPLMVQLALVAYESRVARFRDTAGAALVLTIPAFALAFGALLFAARHRA